MRSVIASAKLLAMALWSLSLIPFQLIVLAVHRGKWAYELPYLWECGVCRIFGIKVIIEGTPNKDKQTIYMGNHLSYLDIPAIASVLKASFVAKAEVAHWPVFGFLCNKPPLSNAPARKYPPRKTRSRICWRKAKA